MWSNKAVQKLNPAQVPVITFDQPLFCYCKDDSVELASNIMVKIISFSCLEDWDGRTGVIGDWFEALVKSNVASPGTADSFVNVSHIKRTRYAHPDSKLPTYLAKRFLQATYRITRTTRRAGVIYHVVWQMNNRKSTFTFLVYSTSVRAHDPCICKIYTNSRLLTVYWVPHTTCTLVLFCLDHTNYARWLPVHVRDMLHLEKAHPEVAL